MTKEKLWQAVLAQIQLEISQANFITWFRDTEICSKKDSEVIIQVPNSFAKEWLEQKYNKTILKFLHESDKAIRKVNYIINRLPPKVLERPKEKIQIDQLEFEEFKVNRETGLNPRYTFENFIVGPFNELPQAAAWAVAKNPGKVYNPLFIYGGVGLGKTHLLEAIGNEVIKNFPERKIRYIPTEKFISEMVTSIRNQTMEVFKSNFRSIDVLIVDDVQFMAGAEKTQEEFFHTFNVLYDQNKQIIISSDSPPKVIPSLTERLRSRFEGGMIADIGLPGFETRMAILKSKLQEKQAGFPEEILSFVASKIQNNIRELEGALNCLLAHRKLNREALTLKKTESLLKNFIYAPVKRVTPKTILENVARFYGLTEKNLKGPSRIKEFVKPRQIGMYLLKEMLDCSYPTIGRRLGGRDHTTVIYGYEKIKKELNKRQSLQEEIKLIKERIKGV